jgi:hypothetical protein
MQRNLEGTFSNHLQQLVETLDGREGVVLGADVHEPGAQDLRHRLLMAIALL